MLYALSFQPFTIFSYGLTIVPLLFNYRSPIVKPLFPWYINLEVKEMKVLIVGAGKLGYKLAQHMILEDIEVVLMDTNPQVLQRINDHIDVLTIVGNGIDIEILKSIHIHEFDLLIGATGSDESNTLICSLGKKLACKKTIARVRNPEYMKQVDFIKESMGIDIIINPDLATAKAIERNIFNSLSFHCDEFAKGKVQMLDFHIGYHEDFIGKRLMDLVGFEHLLITAISRDGKIIIPHGSTTMEENDLIYIIGKSEDVRAFNQKYSHSSEEKKIEKVMILGGSNIAYYLAKSLEEKRIGVKIIEQKKERAQSLSNELNEALIIYGDGTNINLLEEENLDEMDAFVGTTGFDEQNILMAIMAKQAGVRKSIAKISRQNYTKIIDRLDVDIAINPVSITASSILKLIRGGRVESISLLLDGDAEVTEILVGEDSPFINKPLSDLSLPKGIIIGAIVDKDRVIIPKGKDTIFPGNRIVLFCTNEELSTLRKFYRPKKGGRLDELWNNIKGSRNHLNN